MKTCSKCKTEKPKAEFYKDARKKDGARASCKTCTAANHVSYRAASREKIRARQSEYYAANREIIAARNALYKAENRETISACNASYRSANPEKYSAWVAANPDKRAVSDRNRRALKRNAEGKHTADDVRAIFTAQRGLCANCQTKLFKSGKKKYHVDHIMPLVLGGSNWPSNLQCLCSACNLSKHAKDPIKWAKENGRLI